MLQSYVQIMQERVILYPRFHSRITMVDNGGEKALTEIRDTRALGFDLGGDAEDGSDAAERRRHHLIIEHLHGERHRGGVPRRPPCQPPLRPREWPLGRCPRRRCQLFACHHRLDHQSGPPLSDPPLDEFSMVHGIGVGAMTQPQRR